MVGLFFGPPEDRERVEVGRQCLKSGNIGLLGALIGEGSCSPL